MRCQASGRNGPALPIATSDSGAADTGNDLSGSLAGRTGLALQLARAGALAADVFAGAGRAGRRFVTRAQMGWVGSQAAAGVGAGLAGEEGRKCAEHGNVFQKL